jgi:hypothetical protein
MVFQPYVDAPTLNRFRLLDNIDFDIVVVSGERARARRA